jgi:hypothetical protein
MRQLWILLLLCLALAPIFAQQSLEAPSPPKGSEQEKKIEKKEQSQRMLGVLPEFGVTNRQDAPPLTPKGKFRLFYKSAFDPMEFALTGLEAGISQAENSFPAYGQGASGYAKRYGAAFIDQVTSNFFTNFVYPTILKEDPRYFRLGGGTFRTGSVTRCRRSSLHTRTKAEGLSIGQTPWERSPRAVFQTRIARPPTADLGSP